MRYEVDLHNNTTINKTILSLLMATFAVSLSIIIMWYGQSDFYSLFPIYTLAFTSYFILVYKSSVNFYALLGLGILVRVLMLFYFPNLSDDIYRFYWDGKLIISGINPYGVLPTEAINYGIDGLTKDIFDNLNSPNYYTIYPPINQLYFTLSAWIGDISSASIFMKFLVLVTELMGLYFVLKLLDKGNLDRRLSMIYYLNPLVVLEGVGNLHFEVVMLSFWAAGIYYSFHNKLKFGGLFFALSIGVKLLPLMLLPYFWFRLDWRQRLMFFGSLIGFSILIFLPMASGIAFSSFFESVDLYFRKFEFNASIYYILRWFGIQFSGYNLIKYIGPLLALIVVGGNVYIAMQKSIYTLIDFMKYALISWTLYLLLSTTVHPWYIISVVFFTIFLPIRYTVLWSYLIFMTYVNYSGIVYSENYWLLTLEYSVLAYFLHRDRSLIIPYLGKG